MRRTDAGVASLVSFHQFQNSFDYMLSLGTRNQDGRCDDEVHAPKFLVAGDVLRGNAATSLGKGELITSYFVGAQIAFRVRV